MVNDGAAGAADRHVERAIIQRVLPSLVESDRDIERASSGHRVGERVPVYAIEISCQRTGGPSQVSHATFDEIAGEGRLGQVQHTRTGTQRIDAQDEATQMREIRRVVAFARLDLGECKGQGRRHIPAPKFSTAGCDTRCRTARESSRERVESRGAVVACLSGFNALNRVLLTRLTIGAGVWAC